MEGRIKKNLAEAASWVQLLFDLLVVVDYHEIHKNYLHFKNFYMYGSQG